MDFDLSLRASPLSSHLSPRDILEGLTIITGTISEKRKHWPLRGLVYYQLTFPPQSFQSIQSLSSSPNILLHSLLFSQLLRHTFAFEITNVILDPIWNCSETRRNYSETRTYYIEHCINCGALINLISLPLSLFRYLNHTITAGFDFSK